VKKYTVLIAGSGVMAQALLASTTSDIEVLPLADDVVGAAVRYSCVIHVGSEKSLRTALHYCARSHVPLIYASSDLDHYLPSNPEFHIEYVPNFSDEVMDVVQIMSEQLTILVRKYDMTVHIHDEHQKGKTTSSSTAEKLRYDMVVQGAAPFTVTSERKGDVPHAYHTVELHKEGVRVVCGVYVDNHATYVRGAHKIARRVMDAHCE
jgi:Dihydrodipicolinate reductase, C-terminus